MNDQPLTVVNMHLDVTKLEDLSPIMEAVDDFLPGEGSLSLYIILTFDPQFLA